MSLKFLYLVRGVPGAGKSTFARSLGFPMFEADQFYMQSGVYKFDPSKIFLAHKDCQVRLERAMMNGEPQLIVSNTSTTEKEIQPYKELAAKYGYLFVSLIVENRNDTKSIHNVPDDKIEEMKKRFTVKL